MKRSKLLSRLREIKVITKGSFKLRSGAAAQFYCDIKKAYGYPDILDALADEVIAKLSKDIDCIAASGHGGIPLAAAVALKAGKKLIIVRNVSKGHGRAKNLDGYPFHVAAKIAIIDDVLTSGSSIRDVSQKLRAYKECKIVGAVVVVRRGEEKLSIPIQYLFDIQDLQ